MDHDFRKMELKTVCNEKAVYSFADLNELDIPFKIKRIYFIQDCLCQSMNGLHGGGHVAEQNFHKEGEKFLIMAKGKCTVVIDNGNGKEDVMLEAPAGGMYIGNCVLCGLKDFSEDALLIVASSTRLACTPNFR